MFLTSKWQRGATLTTQLVATAVAAVTAAAIRPSIEPILQERELESAAALLRTDLQFGRSAAIARQEPTRLSWQTDPNGSCYVLHTGKAGACACTVSSSRQGATQAACDDSAQVLRAESWSSGRIRIGGASRSVLFDGRLGTVTPTATIPLRNQGGQEIRVIVNIMGRARMCTPTPSLKRIPAC